MQYGYPVSFPYDGSRLYELTSQWALDDPSYSPSTMGISSDFTGGSSGGPWLVGSSPIALSVADYTYVFPVSLRGYMFGPYFGTIAQQLFVSVGGSASGSSATGTIGTPQAASATAAQRSSASNAFTIRFLTRNRSRGVAVFGVKVPGAGLLVLRGVGLRRSTKSPGAAGLVRLPVHAKGSALDELRDEGNLRARARIAYTPSGGSTNAKSRSLTLIRRP
jgi:hypothetical protein